MSPEARTIAQALKTYGAIVADNGSNFYITGASDTPLGRRRALGPQGHPGHAFEVVDTGAQLTDGCD